MRVVHWSLKNGSGMARMAQAFAEGEKAAGLDSVLVDCQNAAEWGQAADADLHVVHTHMPEAVFYQGKPLVWVAHGTPEVMFHGAYEAGLVNGGYGHSDGWMQAQFWLQHCDLAVTFWPRHQAIWQSLADKHTRVACVPMGIDTAFWRPVESKGHYAGAPAVFTAENCYEMKWPLDLFIAWPWVVASPTLHAARLHAIYVPRDQHRWWFPLVNRNGASFHSYISPSVFDMMGLRNAFCSTDFYVGLVRYGDYNVTGLQAAACGAKIISYAGNPYAAYWVHEGDQREMARQLIEILGGQVTPRQVLPVPALAETTAAMIAEYDRLLTRGGADGIRSGQERTHDLVQSRPSPTVVGTVTV